MIRKLLSAGALAALMLAPASYAASAKDAVPAQALSEQPAETDDADIVPAPIALMLALAAAGLIWGRRLHAGARASEDATDADPR